MRTVTTLALTAALFATTGCAFHSHAKNWNDLVGEDSQPTYFKSTTKVGLNALVLLPLLGDLGLDGMVDDMTAEIAEHQGNRVRIVQAGSENYWYGFPPFTWILTPVVATVAAEYKPNAERYAEDQAARK